ncbi:bifunctional cobalt-precorrin-7 (C(5))-methyltransferase/cobalt-precorrin-6B (C(15))-methyltransferase [Actinomadura rubrisoli]|uniref:Cobalamin biosynthesis bifunctional protein CbiET n=1 Tax=Actinomadura rubrisoli TaxID=2530368 RepID=A0A4R5A801_9ACTN|nr:bifunctional cobalt-precorrin-7 (C(5))-methyltransferase CbiE/decarboxylating cobalt-precorrin-6B (C(15))-methyltransferase CbiT [Actinomadura rubrisoli]TDD67240.1 cobalamin biosynthesis bifunctional protein CbiET [Actinomadura rubrisoli]
MLTIIGRDGTPLPEPALAAVRDAALLVGEPGRLADLPVARGVRTLATNDPVGALQGIDVTEQNVVVVVDGDPGYFGIVRELLEQGHAPDVLPSTPLVARAFAQAGLPWEDALVVSARDGNLRRAANACRAHPKVAVLTGPGAGPAELARALFPVTPRSFVVCEDLDGPRERVVYVRPAEATTRPWNDPDVVLVLDNRRALGETGWISGAALGPAGWALPQDAFGEGTGARLPGARLPGARLGLSPDVRAFVLAKLGPRIGDMVWDVESGDGSVGIECARFGAAVVAIERDKATCDRIRESVRLHGVKVAMACGDVRSTIDHMPEPDAVFIGRGGPETVQACAALNPDRIVVIAADGETQPILDALVKRGFTAEAVQLQATRLTLRTSDTADTPGAASAPSPEPADPVIVVWGERGARSVPRRPSRTVRPIETISALPADLGGPEV